MLFYSVIDRSNKLATVKEEEEEKKEKEKKREGKGKRKKKEEEGEERRVESGRVKNILFFYLFFVCLLN